MRRIGVIFPGYGVQYVGMGRKMFEKYDFVKRLFDTASKAIDVDLAHYCFEGNLYELNQIEIAWPSIMVVNIAKYEILKRSYGLKPTVMAGHSLGELSALVCSKMITVEQGFELLYRRTQFIKDSEKIKKDGFAVIENLSANFLENLIKKVDPKGKIAISCYNASSQFAISGESESLRLVISEIRSLDAVVTPILGYPPMHSPMMEVVKPDFEEYLKTVTFQVPTCGIMFSASGVIEQDCNNIIKNLSDQLTNPVNWRKNLQKMIASGINTLIEIGPRRYLTDLNNNLSGSRHFYFDELEESVTLSNHLIRNF